MSRSFKGEGSLYWRKLCKGNWVTCCKRMLMRPLQNFWKPKDYSHLIGKDPFYYENLTNYSVATIVTCHAKDRETRYL